MARAEAYLRAKFHLDPSNRLATVHERYRQDKQTDRQRTDNFDSVRVLIPISLGLLGTVGGHNVTPAILRHARHGNTMLVHGQVTIIFVVSVCLSVCLFACLSVCLCRVFLCHL